MKPVIVCLALQLDTFGEEVAFPVRRALMMMFCLVSACVLAAQTPSTAPSSTTHQDLTGKDLSSLGLELATTNKAIIVLGEEQPELDSGLVLINLESVDGDTIRASPMRPNTQDRQPTTDATGRTSSDEGLISADCQHPVAATEHAEAVRHILTSVREARLTIKDGSRLDHEQLDRILTALDGEIERALSDTKIASQQGGKAEVPTGSLELLGLQLKFSEIFAVTDDNLLIPITETVAGLAPGSTFAGLTAYGKHREVKARITGKFLEWRNGYSLYLREGEPGHYILYFQTDRGHLHPSKNAIMLRWGDIKDKIAYDRSQNKIREDLDMEHNARGIS